MSISNEKLEALFEAAVALENEAQRADYLSRACSDPELRREVETLLASHQNPDPIFLEKAVGTGGNLPIRDASTAHRPMRFYRVIPMSK